MSGEKEAQLAMQLFVSAMERPADPEDTVFVTLTHVEACYLHLVSLLAVEGMRISAGRDTVFASSIAELLTMMEGVDRELWTKIMGAVRVQQLGMDPPDEM